MQAQSKKIYYEPRLEMRSDLSFVETFQDGSQLIRTRGMMVIVEATAPYISRHLKANVKLFSYS